MMKIVALLMAIIAAITIHPTDAQVACFYHYTRGEKGKSGNNVYTGITNITGFEKYDNPLWYSAANAKTGFKVTNPTKGRFSGKLPTTTLVGNMKFDFFSGKDVINIVFTKKTNKGIVKSGSGCYAGITGTAVRKTLVEAPVKVFEWKFCPKAKPKCTPK